MITQSELKSILLYDPLTGLWIRRKGGPGVRVGSFAGHIDPSGYRKIKIGKRTYLSSRLAFLYMLGKFPSPNTDIDHKNRIRSDDRWSNIRKATRSQNIANVPKRTTNTSGYKGVVAQSGTNYWTAILKSYGTIGSYRTKEEAARAYDKAAILIFGEFASLNFSRSDYPEVPVLKRNAASNNSVTGYRGVSLRGDNGRYRAAIYNSEKGKNENLGTFDDAQLAALAYDERAKTLFGENAILNFPERVINGDGRRNQC